MVPNNNDVDRRSSPTIERPLFGTLLDTITKLAMQNSNTPTGDEPWLHLSTVRQLVIEASQLGQAERDAAKLNLQPGDASSNDWIEQEKARLYAGRFVEAEHNAFRDFFVARGEKPEDFERNATGFYKGYGMQERWLSWYASASRYNAHLKP